MPVGLQAGGPQCQSASSNVAPDDLSGHYFGTVCRVVAQILSATAKITHRAEPVGAIMT